MACRAPVSGLRHPRSVELAPRPATPEPRWSELRTQLVGARAALGADRGLGWCPRPSPGPNGEPATTLRGVSAQRPTLADPTRNREMVDALRASREVLKASTGAGFDADTEASQPERLDPGHGL